MELNKYADFLLTDDSSVVSERLL